MLGSKVLNKKIIAGAAAIAIGLVASGSVMAAEKIDFVLNWKPGGDHSPYYWAVKQGWYKDAGLDVSIIEGSGSGAAAKKVGLGVNPIGVIDLPTALQFKGKGSDLVAIMNVYANSAYGLYWKKSSGIKTVKDLKGKKIGAPAFDATRQMWPAVAKRMGLKVDDVQWVSVKPTGKIAALKSDAIDATTHFYNVHYIYERIFGDDLGYAGLRDQGFNTYSLSVFANGKFLKEKPEAAKAFVKVSQRAFVECAANPTPCIENLAKVGSQKVADVTANWNLVKVLIDNKDPNLPFGTFLKERMEHDYKAVEESFDIKPYDIHSAYTNEFLDPALKLKQ
jgi:NitT/TauT family transport system substrate-binding protein